MTVAELRAVLEHMPDQMPVLYATHQPYMDCERIVDDLSARELVIKSVGFNPPGMRYPDSAAEWVDDFYGTMGRQRVRCLCIGDFEPQT